MAAGKGTTFAGNILSLMFNNSNIAKIGDATGVRGSSAAGVLYFSLQTADPGAGGNQGTSETTYTSYARTSKNRASGAGGFTVTGASVSPADTVTFPAGTGGSGTVTNFTLGTDSSGAAGVMLYQGAVSPTFAVGPGVTPTLTTASAITEA